MSEKRKNFNETLRVGVVTYTQDDPFINAMTQELKDNLKSMENDNFRIIVSEKMEMIVSVIRMKLLRK